MSATAPVTSSRRKLLPAQLRALRSRSSTFENTIQKRKSDADVEASEAQQQICVHSMLAPDVCLYNEPVTVHYNGQLSVSALEGAFNEILRRHEAWRTSFHWRDGRMVQKIAPELKVRLDVQDLRRLRSSKREARAIDLATADARKPFDLWRIPLFRLRLVRLSDAEHRLFMTLHHLIFDGVSLYQVFLPELQYLYKCYRDGQSPALSALPIQYPDYSVWQQQQLANGGSEGQLQYWRQRLAGELPILNLPLDRLRPEIRTYNGAMEVFLVPADIAGALKTLAQLHNATLFMVALSAFHVLLYGLTKQCDQIVATAVSTRNQDHTDRLIGLFLNTVPVRVAFSANDRFVDLLIKTRDEVVGVLGNEVPFSQLVQLFHTNRISGLNPLVQVMLSLEPTLQPLEEGWRFTQMDVEMGISKFDLHLELDNRPEGLLSRFIYSTEIFDRSTIVNMRKRWVRLLERISKDSSEAVQALAEGPPGTSLGAVPGYQSRSTIGDKANRWSWRGLFQ